MSFIRRIKRAGRVYLAEVQNEWIKGKCVQRHIRYVGREADGKTLLAASLSEVEVEQVKLYGPLLVLHHLAEDIQLSDQLGPYSQEILSLVYAHCLDYRSLNYMPSWFERTDLNFVLKLDGVTEKRLVGALDSLEVLDAEAWQRQLFERDARESRRDELLHAEELLAQGKSIKPGLERFFDPRGRLLATVLAAAEEFDGSSCIFCTRLLPEDKMLSLYFNKDVVEKAFRSLKGITQLRPVRHWLAERVHAHVFLCYLA